MPDIHITLSMIRLPSADGHGEYDRYAFAPPCLTTSQALDVVNDIIHAVNKEDNDNDGECLDGNSVEENIKRRLSEAGFTWLKVVGTSNEWDL